MTASREALLEKMERAQADLKKRAEAKAEAEREKYEQKLANYEARQENGKRGGQKPKPPENQGPKPTDQANLTDNGYVNGNAIERLQRPKNEGGSGLDIYIPVTSEDGNNERRYDFRPPKDRKPTVVKDKRLLAMQEKMQTEDARKLYSKRKQTVEPVFGIIKSVLGFRGFHLRGLKNVSIEWSLVTLAYNVKRLYALRVATMG